MKRNLPSAAYSKLTLQGDRVDINAESAIEIVAEILLQRGCSLETAQTVADHLADSSLCGVESHGLMRILQYAKQFESGYMDAKASAFVWRNEYGGDEVDGGGGIGIPAMQLAYDHAMTLARKTGIAAIAIRHLGHTGRHGAFAETAADQGFLTILTGGGNRHQWPQVAPYGGMKGVLPTNPWCAGIPGGERGPVVLDFATAKIAGGWIYAAQSAGALLPEHCVIDAEGRPTRNPQDYFEGGAILPSGEQKGYALALVAEMIGEAMLGPSTTECHWLLITIDTRRYREPSAMTRAAEEVLSELRSCPPGPGFDQVEIPGERERDNRARSKGVVSIPEATWQQIMTLHDTGMVP